MQWNGCDPAHYILWNGQAPCPLCWVMCKASTLGWALQCTQHDGQGQDQDHSMTLRSALYGIYYIPIFYKNYLIHFINKRWKVRKVRKSRRGLGRKGGNIYVHKLRGILPLLFEVAAFYFIISPLIIKHDYFAKGLQKGVLGKVRNFQEAHNKHTTLLGLFLVFCDGGCWEEYQAHYTLFQAPQSLKWSQVVM